MRDSERRTDFLFLTLNNFEKSKYCHAHFHIIMTPTLTSRDSPERVSGRGSREEFSEISSCGVHSSLHTRAIFQGSSGHLADRVSLFCRIPQAIVGRTAARIVNMASKTVAPSEPVGLPAANEFLPTPASGSALDLVFVPGVRRRVRSSQHSSRDTDSSHQNKTDFPINFLRFLLPSDRFGLTTE